MRRNPLSASLVALVASMFVVGLVWAGKTGAAGPAAPVADATVAQEYSYSCLGGGCHETNAQLVDGYSKSYMSHVMVKCNACHGTHTRPRSALASRISPGTTAASALPVTP